MAALDDYFVGPLWVATYVLWYIYSKQFWFSTPPSAFSASHSLLYYYISSYLKICLNALKPSYQPFGYKKDNK